VCKLQQKNSLTCPRKSAGKQTWAWQQEQEGLTGLPSWLVEACLGGNIGKHVLITAYTLRDNGDVGGNVPPWLS